jgi:protein involved in polysaccharide export with SLBB domain
MTLFKPNLNATNQRVAQREKPSALRLWAQLLIFLQLLSLIGVPSLAVAQTRIAPQAAPTKQAAPSVTSVPLSAPTAVSAGTPVDEYILSANDKLRVTIFGQPTLSGEFSVDATGNVSLPLIGEVRAAGVSLRTFQRQLEAKLRNGYLVDPRVNAEIMNFRPFYVLGEVRTPGEYPYTAGLTLLNGVAQAGGFTVHANINDIAIKREGTDNEVRVVAQAGIPIAPGDTIRIEKATVYIIGEVKRPSEYPIPAGLNVLTAVAQAEGFTALADVSRVYVKRRGTNEEVETPTNLGSLVLPGDTIRVPKASFFVLGEVMRPGEYPAPIELTINNAAALAGGFTFRADTRRIYIRRSGETTETRVRVSNDLVVRKGDTIRIAQRFF